jgi:pimeloyl-ACP methyl ester carboxylesterase
VDGSGWEGVYTVLRQDGYRVSIVQHPTISLADDVAATTRMVHAQNGPVMLVGHSYGSVVITAAGTDAQVAGLVYIAAFAPDRGESVVTLIKDPPSGRARPTDFAAAGRLPRPRPGTVFRCLRGGRGRRPGCVHGRLPAPVGRGRAQRHDPRAGVEDQAELVRGRHRGPDDPTTGATVYGHTRGVDRRRGRGQSRDLCLAATGSSRAHRTGRPLDADGDALSLTHARQTTGLLRPRMQASLMPQSRRVNRGRA